VSKVGWHKPFYVAKCTTCLIYGYCMEVAVSGCHKTKVVTFSSVIENKD